MLNRFFYALILPAAFIAAAPATSHAQGFVSPLIGYDFGGDSGCPEVTGCEDKNLNIGIGFGTLGSFFGFEQELGYAKNFFGEAPQFSSSVLTFMSNVLLAPKIGPVRPYGTGGIGLIRTNLELTQTSLLDSNNTHFGWNVGGGVMIFAGDHVGVRGEIRHFHAFQDLEVLGIPLSGTKLDFGRASAALILKF